MELKQLGKNTYVIDAQTKIGIYLYEKNKVVIIDTGINEEVGLAIIEICKKQKWEIAMVLNTHSHPDHIGGNAIIQKTLDIPIYTHGLETVIINNPVLISSIAYGGYPHKYLNNDYLFPKASIAKGLTIDILPDGIELIELPGHNADMVGFKTSDDIYFLADAIAGENIISKYKLQFNYDVEKYFQTLEYISSLKGKLFVPSHGDNTEDIASLADLNKETALEIIESIKKICVKGASYEQILAEVFNIYHLQVEFVQYSFIGSTIKCYLSYMLNKKIIKVEFINNILIWETI